MSEIHQAFRRQKHSDKPGVHPQAAQLIARIEDTIDRHIIDLRSALERLGGSESALAPLIMDLSQVLPSVVLSELFRAGKVAADQSVAEEAARNARNAWMPHASVH